MRAFLAAVVVGVILTVGAWKVLGEAGFSAEERYSLGSVRLGE